MKKSYSLYAKLSGLTVTLSLLTVVVGGVGYWGLNRALHIYDHVAEVNLPSAISLASMRGAQKDLIISASLLLGTNATPEDVAKSQKLFDGAVKRFEDAEKAYESHPMSPSEESEWRVTRAAWQPFKEMTQEIIKLSEGATLGDERAAARDALGAGKYVAMQSELLATLNKLIDHQREDSAQWVAAANSAGRQATVLSESVCGVGAICGITFGLLMARSISRTLKQIADQLQSAANEVLSASSHVSSSSQTLAEGATEQAAALQETNASLHQIAATVKQTADGSRQAKNLAEETHRVAQTGRENVISMRTAIEHLLNTSNDTAAIVKTIDEIAFQTNLLALNAAVEAARAGEAGKGFAVVAEEVRNLAQRSAKSAKETAEKIQAAVESSRSVNAGSETILKAVTEIESSISNVNGRISEMATSAVAQSDAVSQIVTAIQQLDSVTQHNAATSEENAAASEELTVQGGNMAAIAWQLTAIVDGRRADAGSHAETSAQKGSL